MAYERRALYPLPFAQQAIARARALGKRVIFVSDMYLPKAFCEEMLRSNGFDDLRRALRQFRLRASEKKHRQPLQARPRRAATTRRTHPPRPPPPATTPRPGDGKRATEHGPATPTPQKSHRSARALSPKPVEAPPPKAAGANPAKACFSVCRRGGCLRWRTLWTLSLLLSHRLPRIAGPSSYGYVRFNHWGQTRGRGPREKKNLSFSRANGYIPAPRLRTLDRPDQPDCPPAGYLYASRRALTISLPSTELNEGTVNLSGPEGIGMSVGQFLQRIGLDPNATLKPSARSAFKGPNQRGRRGCRLHRASPPLPQDPADSAKRCRVRGGRLPRPSARGRGALGGPARNCRCGLDDLHSTLPYTDDPPSRAGSANRGLLYQGTHIMKRHNAEGRAKHPPQLPPRLRATEPRLRHNPPLRVSLEFFFARPGTHLSPHGVKRLTERSGRSFRAPP